MEASSMTAEELRRCKDLLDYFRVSYDKDYIQLTDGGNSCIINMKTQWQEFLGCSINSVAIAVAIELGKKVKYHENRFD